MIRRSFLSILIMPLALMVHMSSVIAQEGKGESIACYKDVIKEPYTFYGNPGDAFTLFGNSTWRVASGGQYEYVPMRYKDVLICPAIGKLIIGNKALSISKN
jgi:hypothetical protein